MLVSSTLISSRYVEAIDSLTNISFNKFVKDQYGVQYKHTSYDNKLLLLIHALESWDNHEGAVNIITETQLLSILDNISKANHDVLSVKQDSVKLNQINFSSVALSIADTATIDLSFNNNQLKGDIRISKATGNSARLRDDGLYIPASGTSVKFLTGADFVAGTNTYNNPTMIGDIQVYHRGLGFLLYDYSNPSNPNNEFTILSTGGFTITIPGFNVHDGDNFFNVIY